MAQKRTNVKKMSLDLFREFQSLAHAKLKQIRQVHTVSSISFMGCKGSHERTETTADINCENCHDERR